MKRKTIKLQEENRPQEKPYNQLSQREQEVLMLLAQNLSDREIAERLYLSYATVKWYNRQIFNKLGVDNRQEAVEQATLLRLIQSVTTPAIPNHNLPAQITPFVGRLVELENIGRLINSPSGRLITVLAPGGMGKTRFALEAAAQCLSAFNDGVYFVPLAALTSSEHVILSIAQNTGFQFTFDEHTPKQQLLDFLRKKQILLVLDNFEHLLECAALVDEILQYASQIKVVVTSRERLNLNGETVFTLGGLNYPELIGEEYNLEYPAVQLFLQCALRAYPQFVLHDEKSMLKICQLVEGMPLAIELAAAWVSTLPLSEIVNEVVRSIDFLSTTMANLPPRMRSIRAVFNGTWARLTEEERSVFSKMAVFHGGFTREAAQIIAGANPRILAALVSKALLWHQLDAQRYAIHELMRQYAHEQLELAGEAETSLTKHRDYFGQYAREWSMALKTQAQLDALDKLDADYENIREAFERAIQTEQAVIVEPFTPLWNYFEIRGLYIDAMRMFDAAIEKIGQTESVALGRLLAGYGLFLERYYIVDKAFVYGQRSVSMLQHLGAVDELPMPMMVLGAAYDSLNKKEIAAAIYAEALEIARSNNDQWAVSLLVFLLGGSALAHKQVDEGKKLISQAYTLGKSLGNIWFIAFTLVWLGGIAYDSQDYDHAKLLFEEGIISARKVRNPTMITDGLMGLRKIAVKKQDFLLARHLSEDKMKISRALGNRLSVCEDTLVLAQIAMAVNNFDEAKHHIREALITGTDKTTPLGSFNLLVPFLLSVAADYFQRKDLFGFSIEILSFIEHDPYLEGDQETMELWKGLLLKAQSVLPIEAYKSSYEHGKSHALEALLDILIVKI